MSKIGGHIAEFAERLARSAVHLNECDKQRFEERLLKIKKSLEI